LGSPPRAVGVLPAAGKAYVAQEHGSGRITFIDLVTLETRTLTGFELNGRVIE